MSELGDPKAHGLTPKSSMFNNMYIEDNFAPGRAEILYPYVKSVLKGLRWVERTRYFAGHSRGFTLYDLLNEGIYNAMPRTRRTPNKSGTDTSQRAAPKNDAGISWTNVSLSDDDVAWLTEHLPTPDACGAMLLAAADRGYNFSVKSMSDGESIMCAIMGFADDDPARSMGVSAFASTAIDATACCLYKFDQLLGGSFKSEYAVTNNNRRRFR